MQRLGLLATTLVILFLPWDAVNAQDKMDVYFFSSPTCGECQEIKYEILEPLSLEYPDRLNIRFFDIDKEEGFQRMTRLEKAYGLEESSAQELFFADVVLTGYEEIMNNADPLIRNRLERPETWDAVQLETAEEPEEIKKSLKDRFQEFTFFSILAAGLVDGVNPCAIATMIFLVSFMAAKKRKQTDIIVIGLSFTAAVYVTYLLLGVGAFHALIALEEYHWISQAVRWSAVALAGIVSIISFWDAFSYKRTGKTEGIKLQLPKPVKMRIHKVISSRLSSTRLITGAVVTGFLVTLLEAVCTGQVYLPTIILMTRTSGLKVTGWLYLLFYNVLFVLPLLVVMILAYYGLKWSQLAKTTQSHLSLLKILLGTVMAVLAVILALA